MTDEPTTIETTDDPAVKPDCDECHGRVLPGHYCPACGLNRCDEITATFITLSCLPYTPPALRCCEHAAVEVHEDYDARGAATGIWVLHTHTFDCDVWLYL